MTTITKEVKITISPEECAEVFSGMNSEQQALFFNSLAEYTSKWKGRLEWQLQAIANEKCLTEGGRNIMDAIGPYGVNDKMVEIINAVIKAYEDGRATNGGPALTMALIRSIEGAREFMESKFV